MTDCQIVSIHVSLSVISMSGGDKVIYTQTYTVKYIMSVIENGCHRVPNHASFNIISILGSNKLTYSQIHTVLLTVIIETDCHRLSINAPSM